MDILLQKCLWDGILKIAFDLVVNIDRLKKVNFVNTSNDTWCKTNIIEGLEKFCTVMFYEDKNIVDSSQEEHCYIKSKITATSNPYFIRTTRSKRKNILLSPYGQQAIRFQSMSIISLDSAMSLS